MRPKSVPGEPKWSQNGALRSPKSCQEAVQEHLESAKGNYRKSCESAVRVSKIQGLGRSGKALKAVLEALGGQNEGQVGSPSPTWNPTWQYKSNLKPSRHGSEFRRQLSAQY